VRRPGKHFRGLASNEVYFHAVWNKNAQRMIVQFNVGGKKNLEAMTAERYEAFCCDLLLGKMVIAGWAITFEGGDESEIRNYFIQVLESFKKAKEQGNT
jgi:hypothetical protein